MKEICNKIEMNISMIYPQKKTKEKKKLIFITRLENNICWILPRCINILNIKKELVVGEGEFKGLLELASAHYKN